MGLSQARPIGLSRERTRRVNTRGLSHDQHKGCSPTGTGDPLRPRPSTRARCLFCFTVSRSSTSGFQFDNHGSYVVPGRRPGCSAQFNSTPLSFARLRFRTRLEYGRRLISHNRLFHLSALGRLLPSCQEMGGEEGARLFLGARL